MGILVYFLIAIPIYLGVVAIIVSSLGLPWGLFPIFALVPLFLIVVGLLNSSR